MKIVSLIGLSFMLGLLSSIPFLQWFIERDRHLIEIASDTGFISFYGQRILSSSENEFMCLSAKMIKIRAKQAIQHIENLSAPRFYEPKGTVSVYMSEIPDIKDIVESTKFTNIINSCSEL